MCKPKTHRSDHESSRLRHILVIAAALVTFGGARENALAQTHLPDAPSQLQAGTQSPAPPSQGESSGATLSGTIVDKEGALLQGAQVTLSGPVGFSARTVRSGNDGQFEFQGLQPNIYIYSR